MRVDRRGVGLVCPLLLGCAATDPGEDLRGFCPSAVVLNEVMAAGDLDWIELYNNADEDADLAGYGLSRADRTIQFVFPADDERTLVPGRGYLFVWADTYEVVDRDEFTVGYDLNRDGDALHLRAPASSRWAECDALFYPDQHQDVAWARIPDGGDWCYAASNTPAAPNAPACFPTR